METEDFTPKSAHQYVRDLLHSIQALQPIWQQQGQSATQWLDQQLQNGNIPQYAATNMEGLNAKTKVEEKEKSSAKPYEPKPRLVDAYIPGHIRAEMDKKDGWKKADKEAFEGFIKENKEKGWDFAAFLAEGYYNGSLKGKENNPYAFEKNHEFAIKIKNSREYRNAMHEYFDGEARRLGPGRHPVGDPNISTGEMVRFRYAPELSELGNALGGARAFPVDGFLVVKGDGKWEYSGEMAQKDNYTFDPTGSIKNQHPQYNAAHALEKNNEVQPFYHKETWDEYMNSEEKK